MRPDLHTGAGRLAPWASLAFFDYRLLWASSLLGGVGLQMRQFANIWQVYDISHSPLQLGLTGLFQAIPLFAIGLFAGTVADTFDRKKLLIISQALNLLLALALGVLTATGVIEVWHIYVITSLTSAVNIFGQPARAALIPALVPRSHLMNAIVLNTTTFQMAFLIGPFLGGILISVGGAASAYLLNAVIFGLVLLVLLPIKVAAAKEEGMQGASLALMAEGLRFVWRTRIILALILLDTVATLFGAYRALMPIFAEDILEVGVSGLGALMSAPAFGAFLGTLGLLVLGNIKRTGLLVLASTAMYAGALALFGVSGVFVASLVVAGALGFFDSIGMSVRQTTLQLLTPDRLRGRATSVMQVFSMGAPSLGYVVAGVMASAIGAPSTLFVGSVVCVVVTGAVAVGWAEVRRYES